MRSSSAEAQPPAVDLPLSAAQPCLPECWLLLKVHCLHKIEAAIQSGMQVTALVVSVNAAGGQDYDGGLTVRSAM